VYFIIRHNATDNIPAYVFDKWRIPKEWPPALAMLIWCTVFWKKEEWYTYIGIALSVIGFIYGFNPVMIKN